MAINPTFLLVNIRKKNVFYDILERENAFLGYKNKKFKSWKIGIFPKGVNPWFCSKMDIFPKGLTHGFGINMAIFSRIFFGQYRPGKCLIPYFRTKTAFLGYKNKKFKNSKNWHFSKGVNPWFWSKNGHFLTFFLGNIFQQNVF